MIRMYLKIPEKFVRFIFGDRFWVVQISFVRMIKFKLLAQFLMDPLPTQTFHVLYYFCTNFVHLLIMWLIVSSLSPHFFSIIQRVKARAVPCPHQLSTRGDNWVSVAQAGTATPGATKQVLPPNWVLKELYIYIYIYMPDQLRAETTLDVNLHFQCAVCDLKKKKKKKKTRLLSVVGVIARLLKPFLT